MQIFQRIGDESGVLNRFTDGTGLGGAEIGGLDPLALRGRNARRRRGRTFVAAIFPTVITSRFTAIFPTVVPTRFTGLRCRFRCCFGGGFAGRLSFVVFGCGGVGGEFSGHV